MAEQLRPAETNNADGGGRQTPAGLLNQYLHETRPGRSTVGQTDIDSLFKAGESGITTRGTHPHPEQRAPETQTDRPAAAGSTITRKKDAPDEIDKLFDSLTGGAPTDKRPQETKPKLAPEQPAYVPPPIAPVEPVPHPGAPIAKPPVPAEQGPALPPGTERQVPPALPPGPDRFVPPVPETPIERAPIQQRPETPAQVRDVTVDGRSWLVRLPENFDPTRQVNVVVFDHGWYTSAHDSFAQFDFEKQMHNAPPNSILVIPEWQTSPKSSEYAQGNFAKGAFSDKVLSAVNQAMKQTGNLSGVPKYTWDDVNHVDILSHSAGHAAVATEMDDPKTDSKLRSLTLLDSDYRAGQFGDWLTANAAAIARGDKQFNDIYCENDRGKSTKVDTHDNSDLLTDALSKLAKRQNNPGIMSTLAINFDGSSPSPTPEFLATHSAFFRSTSYEHYTLVSNYPGIILESLKLREQGHQ